MAKQNENIVLLDGETQEFRTERPGRYVVQDFRSKFCPQLMRRLYPITNRIVGPKGKLIILINIIDCSSEKSIQGGQLVYAGMLVLKDFLETKYGKFPRLRHPNRLPDSPWEYLNAVNLGAYEAIASKASATDVANNIPVLKNLGIKNLKRDYFPTHPKPKASDFGNEPQGFEYAILDHVFSIPDDYYITLPLIQFGKYDGSVHVIFEEQDKGKLQNRVILKHLIQQYSEEYENLLLEWGLVVPNENKLSLVEKDLKYLVSSAFQQEAEQVRLLKELGYRQYYKESVPYFLERVRQLNVVPALLKAEHRKRAIISILVDSFAHNISAHSLTVLKWWFQQRAEGTNRRTRSKVIKLMEEKGHFADWGNTLKGYLDAEKVNYHYDPEKFQDGIHGVLARWIGLITKHSEKEYSSYRPIRDQLSSLAEQLHPLFKFLLEKGAFWSGVTRDRQFGGEIQDLYTVLWDEFVNNPLYLGTIVYSEKITRLNLHIRLYSSDPYEFEGKDEFLRTYKIEKTADGQLLDGLLASVSVGGEEGQKGDAYHKYITAGDLHDEFQERLRECFIFFPGGVVGKHAFFTLLENEIRNAKHYPPADLKKMQENGLDLYIGIRLGTLDDKLKSETQSVYKIGIWLNHKTDMWRTEEHLVVRRLDGMMEDIITDDTNEARLGGTYQDKICSAMLFNGFFSSVQKGSRKPFLEDQMKMEHYYYPWVRAAFNDETLIADNVETDIEVRADNLGNARKVLASPEFPKIGYLKKYIHLWRGEEVYHIDENTNLAAENFGRFKMVTYSEPNETLKENLQEAGVIRAVSGLEPGITHKKAMQQWLRQWLKHSDRRIDFCQGDTEIGYLIYDQEEVVFYNKRALRKLSREAQNDYKGFHSRAFKFEHSRELDNSDTDKSRFLNAQNLGIRSDGIFTRYFFPEVENINDFKSAHIEGSKMLELLETIETQVSVFDKRLFDRVAGQKQRGRLKKHLLVDIYQESDEDWVKFKQTDIAQNHFIIVHLSLIEAMQNSKGGTYREEGIVDFIEDHLKEVLNERCLLVITTGRGRTLWWKKLQESKSGYAQFVTFRPIESLIEAVEKASLKRDDIELKYNLIKVLFGS